MEAPESRDPEQPRLSEMPRRSTRATAERSDDIVSPEPLRAKLETIYGRDNERTERRSKINNILRYLKKSSTYPHLTR